MNTYVYNNENQRLVAELDENNYASFYYYYNEKLVERSGVKATNDISLIIDPDYDAGIFDTTFYFTTQNGRMVPTETFSSYGIVYNESTDQLFK